MGGCFFFLPVTCVCATKRGELQFKTLTGKSVYLRGMIGGEGPLNCSCHVVLKLGPTGVLEGLVLKQLSH